jgi:hypothetical protein
MCAWCLEWLCRDDNAAGYSFWSQHNLSVWGAPQSIYISLKQAYAQQAIPVRQWEIDPRGIHDPLVFTSYGWCYLDWITWNKTRFPGGGHIKDWLLDNGQSRPPDSAVYYMSPFSNRTVHRRNYSFAAIGHWPERQDRPQPQLAETLPGDTARFYGDMMRVAKEQWGMAMLFLDFLCLRAPHLQTALPREFEAGQRWLRAVGEAAAALDIQLQMCMACPHQALVSLDMPAATNARVNGDSGMAVPDMIYSSVLAAAVGLGWSKDNLRLRNSWSQGATEVQVVFAALSLGPAGLADRLEGFPAIALPGAAVMTNRTLALSLCASNGALLQPSFPLTAVDAQLAGTLPAGSSPMGAGLGRGTSPNDWTINAMATYTTVSAGGGGALTAFVVAAFVWREPSLDDRVSASWHQTPPPNASRWTLRAKDLTTLIDCENYPPTAFHHVPNGAYKDTGSHAASVGHHHRDQEHSCLLQRRSKSGSSGEAQAIVWIKGTEAARVFAWSPSDVAAASLEMVSLTESPTLVYVTPVSECGIALLGEEGKVTMLSTYRWASTDVDAKGLMHFCFFVC